MKKEYLQLTLEELIENRDFVAWILHGQHHKEWETFLSENQEFKSTAKKARKIVELLRDSQDHLSENEILDIWRNIENFDEHFRENKRQIKIYRIMRYAAILVFAMLLGSSAYWMQVQNQKSFTFMSSLDQKSITQSRLFLADGTSVDLKKQNSKIALNAEKQIVIDDNQFIDMSKKRNIDESKMNEVVIPAGKKSQLLLEDGTKVWLNSGSRMAFPTKFSGKKREVFLEGEAYFEVAHNNNFPFQVNTGEIAIKVLGTKFNLSAYSKDKIVETTLLEGKVTVSKRSTLGFLNHETTLAPYQKASFDKENKTISVKNEPDVEFAIAWTEGWFKFSHQSLNDVLNKLQRYYDIQFVFDSDFSTADLITGKLDLKDSINQVMSALSDVAKIQYRVNGNQIYIEKK